MSRTFTSSRPTEWVSPRPYTDATLRQHTYGKVRPMAEHKQARLGAGLGAGLGMLAARFVGETVCCLGCIALLVATVAILLPGRGM